LVTVQEITKKYTNTKDTYLLHKNKLTAKPFLKWAGGKTQILEKIRQKYPLNLGKTITKYAEPFVGGGAVLFDVLNNFSLEEVYISDINRELIESYIQIRDNVNELIITLDKLESEYLPLSTSERKDYYYTKRDEFNAFKAKDSVGIEMASLLIFLNKTCFNGLYRVNQKGEFNVPVGSYKKPNICDADNLLAVSKKLQGVDIVCGDYKESEAFIDDKTFAYFDPPYRPLSATSSFTSYAQNGFDDEKQAALADFIKRMSERGACVVASNSDPKNTDENDNFFDDLYSSLSIERISASRAINSVATGRGSVSELLISNCGGLGA
jgi:DNA adenine methylase